MTNYFLLPLEITAAIQALSAAERRLTVYDGERSLRLCRGAAFELSPAFMVFEN